MFVIENQGKRATIRGVEIDGVPVAIVIEAEDGSSSVVGVADQVRAAIEKYLFALEPGPRVI